MHTARNDETRDSLGGVRRPHRGRLAFYHPNRKGNGSAFRLELRLNRADGERYDCFFLEMARQKPPEDVARPATVSFDWESRATVKLDIADLSALLLVLEGKKEQAGGANGIYHETGSSNTRIDFRRESSRNGYLMAVSKKSRTGEALFQGALLLTDAEALAMRCVFQTGLFFLVFHENIRN